MELHHARIAIIGAGIMGSAAAWALARRGAQVDVFEQQGATQRRGSAHGETRGIRLAYEDPEYASWAEEALRAWRAVEVERLPLHRHCRGPFTVQSRIGISGQTACTRLVQAISCSGRVSMISPLRCAMAISAMLE